MFGAKKVTKNVHLLDSTTGVKPQLISVAIMLGASSAFVSPFGYQTNLMVYGAGNYKTMEFCKYGAGLKVRISGSRLLHCFAPAIA